MKPGMIRPKIEFREIFTNEGKSMMDAAEANDLGERMESGRSSTEFDGTFLVALNSCLIISFWGRIGIECCKMSSGLREPLGE
jgi:hypothetical protein